VLIALANSQSIVIASRKYVLYARDDEKGNCDGRHPQSAGLAEDGSIDVDFAGGRLKTPDGQLVSWRVSPIRYCVPPGHAYLMELTEHPDWETIRGFDIPPIRDGMLAAPNTSRRRPKARSSYSPGRQILRLPLD